MMMVTWILHGTEPYSSSPPLSHPGRAEVGAEGSSAPLSALKGHK